MLCRRGSNKPREGATGKPQQQARQRAGISGMVKIGCDRNEGRLQLCSCVACDGQPAMEGNRLIKITLNSWQLAHMCWNTDMPLE